MKNENKELEFSVDDFKLAEKNDVGFDKKFETKQTTFAKDAFKRFRKNRSSVIAAFIIGTLLLMSVFVPLLSPHSTDNAVYEKLLTPKLFNSGFGFWDGTYDVDNTLYNVFTEETSYNSNGIVDGSLKLSNEGEHFTDVVIEGAYGGNLVLTNTTSDTVFFQNDYGISFSSDQDFDFIVKAVTPTDQLSVLNNKFGDLAKFSVTINYTTLNTGSEVLTKTLLSETNEYKEYVFSTEDIFKVTNEATSINNAQFSINVHNTSAKSNYVVFEKVEFNTARLSSTDETELALKEELEFKSIKDVNSQLLITAASNAENYWIGTADDYVSQANLIYASFKYDPYDAVYGVREASNVTTNDLKQYVDNGWMKFDFSASNLEEAKESFEIISDKCPIVEILKYDVENHPLFGNVATITASVVGYKYMGYNSMPVYLLGTNDSGKDLITLAFSGLATSLMIAIIVSAICFTIGIIWGSISGYYGGKTDLIMERVLDVLARIPRTVLITLVILLFGNNIWVFLFALCVTGWVGIAARTRTQFYRFKNREYVLVSRTLGAKDRRLIFKHILPNGLGTIITASVLMIPGVIFTEASLAYIGLGLQGTDTIGVMLSSNQKYLSDYPALVVFPALIISLLMISFNLFGNGLRDAVNPSLKGSE